jgi:hypothetical protein
VAGIGLASLLSIPFASNWAGRGVDALRMRQADAAQRRVSVESRARTIDGQQVGEVLVDQKVIFRIRTGAGGYTAPQRAQVVAERLSDMVNSGNLSANDVRESFMNGERVLTANGELLITADQYHARVNGTTPTALAGMWEHNLQNALMGMPVGGSNIANNLGSPVGNSGRYGSASLSDVGPTLRTKMVPILSAGTGIRLGLAQVTGPKRNVDDVKAVAELQTEWKRAARARLYVPISDLNVTKGIHRVPRVGVSGLANVRLKF